MGRQLRINGQLEDHEEDKTVKQLKTELGIPANDTLTYNDGTDTYPLADTDTAGEIPEASTIASLPDPGSVRFGSL